MPHVLRVYCITSKRAVCSRDEWKMDAFLSRPEITLVAKIVCNNRPRFLLFCSIVYQMCIQKEPYCFNGGIFELCVNVILKIGQFLRTHVFLSFEPIAVPALSVHHCVTWLWLLFCMMDVMFLYCVPFRGTIVSLSLDLWMGRSNLYKIQTRLCCALQWYAACLIDWQICYHFPAFCAISFYLPFLWACRTVFTLWKLHNRLLD